LPLVVANAPLDTTCVPGSYFSACKATRSMLMWAVGLMWVLLLPGPQRHVPAAGVFDSSVSRNPLLLIPSRKALQGSNCDTLPGA
jgi:hypothetical protein